MRDNQYKVQISSSIQEALKRAFAKWPCPEPTVSKSIVLSGSIGSRNSNLDVPVVWLCSFCTNLFLLIVLLHSGSAYG